MIDPIAEVMSAEVERLEQELVVRDFLELLELGCVSKLQPFLADDVEYITGATRKVVGSTEVLSALREIVGAFDEFRAVPVHVAVGHDVVLVELNLGLRLRGREAIDVLSFARFTVRDARISAWVQTYA